MINAYAGQYLEINLTKREVKKIAFDQEFLRKHVGGSGIGAALFSNYWASKDFYGRPLSPENPLIFMTGPLTGSLFPATPRLVVCAQSPLTNTWGEANTGGHWGAELKKAGYDGVVIFGKAKAPVVIYIDNDDIKIEPADDLWGLDTYELAERLGGKEKILSIGQAGENQSPLASIATSKHNFFGRCGMGAVMGSKNLKAIIVRGSGKYQYADADKAKVVRARMMEKVKASPFNEFLSDCGSNAIDGLYEMGDVPIKNWQLGLWDQDKINNLSAASFKEKFVTGHSTCFACPVACKTNLKVDDEKFKVVASAGPEYETVAGFGSLLLNDNPAVVAKANELCNRYCMDTISVASVIAVAMECFEKGYITTKDTGDLELNWGDGEIIIELVHEIGQNKGFGIRLAKGGDAFVDNLAMEAKDCLASVKGLDAPFHDPRKSFDLSTQYMTGYRGACHVSASNVYSGVEKFPTMMGTDSVPEDNTGQALLVKEIQDLGNIFGSAACFCYFGADEFGESDLLDSLNTATGFDYTYEELMELGEKIWCLKRTLSNLWGLRSEDDVLPKRLATPLAEGPIAGLIPELDQLKEIYYQLRGIDSKGFLSDEMLVKMDIPEHLAKEIKRLREDES